MSFPIKKKLKDFNINYIKYQSSMKRIQMTNMKSLLNLRKK